MIERSWTHTWVTKSGIKLKARIGPYVWMYHSGKIDAAIVEDERGCELRPSCKELNFSMENTTPEELVAFVEGYEYPESDCKVCGYHMLAHASHYRTNDECDMCCKDRLTKEYKAEAEKMKAREQSHDIKMYKQGWRYKVAAWIHTNAGDDDELVFYTKVKPTDVQIRATLKKHSSEVLSDFVLTELKGA